MARDNPCEGGGMLPFELLLRGDVISVEEPPFSDECFPPLIASKQEQHEPIVIVTTLYFLLASRRKVWSLLLAFCF